MKIAEVGKPGSTTIGLPGASVLASAGFEEGAETKRPSVQVGDPFEEKRLIEACLTLLEAGLAVGVQDLGAGGLSGAASEIAANSGLGMDVDVFVDILSVSSGGSLYAEACAALYESARRPLVLSFMAGMGGEAIVLKEFYWMTNKMLEAQKRGAIEKRTHWVGFEE